MPRPSQHLKQDDAPPASSTNVAKQVHISVSVVVMKTVSMLLFISFKGGEYPNFHRF